MRVKFRCVGMLPCGPCALPDFPGLFEKSSFKMADSQRLVRVKTRTKAFFFEEILINIPSKNLPKLSKERMQYFRAPEYFCHALKLNSRSRHSTASASTCSMNRSLEPKITWGSRVGVVVRALAFHQCVPGSIPGPGVICGLSLLVLYSAPRGFSPGTPVFPSPQKPTFDLI